MLSAVKVGRAVNITWVGGDNSWVDGGSTANWSPADEPDFDDVAIFNTNNVVQLGSNNTIAGLTMSNSIELNLNGNTLNVAGLTSLTGADTTLTIAAATAVLSGQNVTVASGATVAIEGGGTLNGQDITANNNGTVTIVGSSAEPSKHDDQ